jgi:hypothetical protein
MNFDSSFLFASLLWGSIGVGYFIFGKKQGSTMPLIGGLAMIAVSYVVSGWLLMSLISIALIAATHWLMKLGY